MARAARRTSERMTVAEFLDASLDPAVRWELVDGVPVAQAAPRHGHGRLQSRLTQAVANALDVLNAAAGSDCQPVTETGIVTPLDPAHNFRVVDLAVSCTPQDADAPFTDMPVLLVEILSPDQEREQRAKFQAFAALASVREILFLDSRSIRAELHRRRPDGAWPSAPQILGEGDRLVLDTAGLSIPLAELYREIVLPLRSDD